MELLKGTKQYAHTLHCFRKHLGNHLSLPWLASPLHSYLIVMYVYEEGKDIEAQGSKSKSTNSMASWLQLWI